MSQDNLVIMSCTVCKNKNYYTFRNKKQVKEKLGATKPFKKHCPKCRKHTEHKEGKKK